ERGGHSWVRLLHPSARALAGCTDLDEQRTRLCYSGRVTRVLPERKGKERIDALLVARGLIESRHRAQALVLACEVKVDGETVTKPGAMFRPTVAIEVMSRPPFVSRGGEKLAH